MFLMVFCNVVWAVPKQPLSHLQTMIVKLVNSQTGDEHGVRLRNLNEKKWGEVTIPFLLNKHLPGNRTPTVDEIQLLLEKQGELLIDDLLLYGLGE